MTNPQKTPPIPPTPAPPMKTKEAQAVIDPSKPDASEIKRDNHNKTTLAHDSLKKR